MYIFGQIIYFTSTIHYVLQIYNHCVLIFANELVLPTCMPLLDEYFKVHSLYKMYMQANVMCDIIICINYISMFLSLLDEFCNFIVFITRRTMHGNLCHNMLSMCEFITCA